VQARSQGRGIEAGMQAGQKLKTWADAGRGEVESGFESSVLSFWGLAG
jgi:hypothetical protein